MFIDVAKIHIKAGNGGDGAVTFRREKYVAAGGPDGGDGGKGGDVIFVVDTNMSTLADFRYKRKYKAANGANGSGNHCYGRGGENITIKVPLGTVIRDAESGRLLHDMSDGEPFIAAHGGRGGWGNSHFASSTRQVPRFAKSGIAGEELDISLELKLLADVGLVGFPNVGKSTLVSVVSDAKPIIADYHFTTLIPVLGVVRMGPESSFVMADIPGLIEGAGEGVGLGHEFLRHVERCRLLVHIVDVSGSEARDPKQDFEIINNELQKFNSELAECPMIVVGNKIDMATDEQREDFKNFIEEKGLKYFEMIAPIQEGTQELVNAIAEELSNLPPLKKFEEEVIPEDELPKNRHEFTVTKEDDVYYVEGEWIAKILAKTNPDDYESLQYFQRTMEATGVFDALRAQGIAEGDTVCIYDFEFEYVP